MEEVVMRFLHFMLVVSFAALSGVTAVFAAAPTKEVQVNGVTLTYVDAGQGEPIVFVHGAISDHSVWEPVGQALGSNYRFIAPTQRYFGTKPWPDNGEQFGQATHAKDIGAFIKTLDVGPVHLVGWSYGADVAIVVAMESPELLRSLIVYEPSMITLVREGEAGKAAREAGGKMFDPVTKAVTAGDAEKATKLALEGVWQLPAGGFDRLPSDLQKLVLENARTVPPMWGDSGVPVTCDKLKGIATPTLVIHGADTNAFFAHIAGVVDECVPQSDLAVLPNVNHDGPYRDPKGLAVMIKDFVAQH
jgi:pimeloyl-ACP methyl ester carboxylesterase